jgi:hypothetical protein
MLLNNLSLSGEAGNQRLRSNKSSNTTSDPLVSPVTAQELADFLSIAYSSADASLYNGFLLAATDACIKHTNIELLEREYTFKSDRYPERQQGYGGVGIMYAYRSWWINLPVYPVISVDSVTVDGTAADDPMIDLDSRPARVEPKEMGAVVIEYTAGHATAAQINPQLLLGIKMYAAYLYEHRGMCDVNEALKSSGASALWDSARMVVTL